MGAAAALIGLTFAACGDDTEQTDMGAPDLSANNNPDLTANMDLTVGADMTAAPGNGQALLSDVVGTVWQPIANDGGATPAPQTHLMLATASFPQISRPSDFDKVDISKTTFAITGCAANRYDIPTKAPLPDLNVGNVTMTGYSGKLMTPAPGANMANLLPAPATITCVNPGGAVPFYGCVYGNPTGTGINGKSALGTVFPIIPATMFDTLCTLSGAGCSTAGGDCKAITIGANAYCEQQPYKDDPTNNFATIDVPGDGTLYGAFKDTIGGPNQTTTLLATKINNPLFIQSIKVGTTDVTATKTLEDLDGQLDGTKDVTITWACDAGGTACTGGATLNPDKIIISGVTSANPRETFKVGAKYGTLTCFEGTPKGTITIPADAIKTMLGGQTGGTAFMVLTRIAADASILTDPNHAAQLHAAGRGQFAFVPLK